MDFDFGLGDILNFAGGFLDRDADRKRAHENQDLQREFAQNGIQWKVEDAKKAGIAPLAALGSQTMPYQPAFDSTTTSFANMGQDIGRAIDATRTGKARTDARLTALQLERGELENDLLRSQIAKLNATPNPPMPDLTSNSGMPPELTANGGGKYVKELPLEVTHTEPGRPGKEVGVLPDYTFTRTADGGMVPVPSGAVKQRIDDSFIPDTLWSIRNNILPNFGAGPPKPPKGYLPEGYTDWKWSYIKQAFYPVKAKPYTSRRSREIQDRTKANHPYSFEMGR